jgi:uncharacterized protein (DUF697 family)
MALFSNWTWKKLGHALFQPRAPGIDSKIEEVKQRLPIPVFWLLGKAQAGKTSLIRALTGNDAAAIGNGFQPCTRQSRLYDFPSSSHPLIRFLDTRGLGETAYDPGEDMAWCQQQAHLLIVVLRALDMNQAEIVAAVKTIHKRHPEWPLIVVQTALHEGYPQGMRHSEPYPFATTPFPPTVPHGLAQALLHQREWFRQMPAQFVAVDYTLPEDGYVPVFFGVDALWDAIATALPHTFVGLLRGSSHYKAILDFHADEAHPHILGYALLNVGMGAVPVAGLPLVLAVQAKLFHSIASIYELPMTRRLYGEFTALIGSGVGIGLLGRELLKLIPVYGWMVAGVYSGAVTYALGRAFCLYLHGVKRGALPDQVALQQLYKQAFAEARQWLQQRGT